MCVFCVIDGSNCRRFDDRLKQPYTPEGYDGYKKGARFFDNKGALLSGQVFLWRYSKLLRLLSPLSVITKLLVDARSMIDSAKEE